jgi:hypothetical protein
VSNEPLPVDLAVAIGDAHREVLLRTIFTRRNQMLNAVARAELASVVTLRSVSSNWSAEKVSR